MGLFDSIKNVFDKDGVTVQLKAPHDISDADTTIPLQIVISSRKNQLRVTSLTFHYSKVAVQDSASNAMVIGGSASAGDGGNAPYVVTIDVPVGVPQTIDYQLTLSATDTIAQIKDQLPTDQQGAAETAAAVADTAMKIMGGLQSLSAQHYAYRINVEINVEGWDSHHPNDSASVLIRKPGEIIKSITI